MVICRPGLYGAGVGGGRPVSRHVKFEFCVDMGGGGGSGQGARLSHLVSRNFKAEFHVVVGGGGCQRARLSHLVSRNFKAHEFCVVIGGGGRPRGRPRGANITLSEQTCQNSRFKLYVAVDKGVNSAFGTPKRWPLAALEGWPLVRGKYSENTVRACKMWPDKRGGRW